MERFCAILATHNLVAGQVLLTPYDFIHRTQYLHARQTLRRLLDLGAVPIVNENDTVADDEIRYGDNDRLAALVAHLVGADLLLLLTDTSGLMTADPRVDEAATLIEEIAEVDAALEAVAGGTGSDRGSGGMASKLAAAKIAAWSGVRAVIAARRRARRDPPGRRRRGGRHRGAAPGQAAQQPQALDRLRPGCPRPAGGRRRRPPGAARSRAAPFCPPECGRWRVASTPTTPSRSSAPTAAPSPRGSSATAQWLWPQLAGSRTSDLPEGAPHEVIHRDDLVVLP